MTPDELLSSTYDGVRELRLNRPQRRNALTHALAKTLLDEVQRAQADEAVRVLLITAEGPGFCAGKDRDDPATDAFVTTLQQLAASLLLGPKPVVAAVQGWAVGAGFELALGCDLIVAGTDARFKLPEAQLNLPATGGVHLLLPRIVGLSRAKGLQWLGETIDASQALASGLVWALAEPEALRQRALALCASLAALEPATARRIKRLVHAEALPDVAQALRREEER